jgi:hypothetical protein
MCQFFLKQEEVEEAMRSDLSLSRYKEAIRIPEKHALLQLLAQEMQNGSDGEPENSDTLKKIIFSVGTEQVEREVPGE